MTPARMKYRTLTACIWAVGAVSWLALVFGYTLTAVFFLILALAMTGAREDVFVLEVRGLDRM